MKNKIFHTQDLCLRTNLRCAKMGIIMIRKAELKDIPAVMDIYNDAILHTTATFDTEIKDYEDRLAWFQAHTGQYVIFVYEEAQSRVMPLFHVTGKERLLTLQLRSLFIFMRVIEGVALAAVSWRKHCNMPKSARRSEQLFH